MVITVGKISGGTTDNVIPNEVEMAGTVRVLNPEIRKMIPEALERIIKGIVTAHRASYDFYFEFGYPPVINDEEVVKIVEKVAKNLYGEEALKRIRPVMVGEDFSAYLEKVPGAFIFVGASNEEKGIIYPHHHPRFNIVEDALEMALKLLVYSAFELVEKF